MAALWNPGVGRRNALLKRQNRRIALGTVTTVHEPSSQPRELSPAVPTCVQTTDIRRRFAFGRISQAEAKSSTIHQLAQIGRG